YQPLDFDCAVVRRTVERVLSSGGSRSQVDHELRRPGPSLRWAGSLLGEFWPDIQRKIFKNKQLNDHDCGSRAASTYISVLHHGNFFATLFLATILPTTKSNLLDLHLIRILAMDRRSR